MLPAKEAVCRAGVSLHQLAKRPSEHPFHGLLASQLQCKHCGHQVKCRYESLIAGRSHDVWSDTR